MADATTTRTNVYKASGIELVDWLVDDDVAAPVPIGTLTTPDYGTSSSAIPAAADGIRVAVVVDKYTTQAGDVRVLVDVGGAILELDMDAPGVVGDLVGVVDNQTVQAEADPTKQVGSIVKVTGATSVQVHLRKFSTSPYAS